MYNMYIEIDSLLDTRINFLRLLSEPLYNNLITNTDYVTRKNDRFSFISAKDFNRLYSKRDRRVIINPRPILLRDVIIEYLLKQKEEHIRHGLKPPFKLFLNIYPYKLSSLEEETLVTGVKSMLPRDIVTEVINIKPEVNFFKEEGIITIFKYDGLAWLEEEAKSGRLRPYELIDKVIFVPKLVGEDSSTIDTLMDVIDKMIRLEMTDASLWSSIDLVMIEREQHKETEEVYEEKVKEKEEEIIVDLSPIEKMIQDSITTI